MLKLCAFSSFRNACLSSCAGYRSAGIVYTWLRPSWFRSLYSHKQSDLPEVECLSKIHLCFCYRNKNDSLLIKYSNQQLLLVKVPIPSYSLYFLLSNDTLNQFEPASLRNYVKSLCFLSQKNMNIQLNSRINAFKISNNPLYFEFHCYFLFR